MTEEEAEVLSSQQEALARPGGPAARASSRTGLAGPLMLQSSFAAQFYTQDIWDFGIEQLLLQGSFWEQLLPLLQVPHRCPPCPPRHKLLCLQDARTFTLALPCHVLCCPSYLVLISL